MGAFESECGQGYRRERASTGVRDGSANRAERITSPFMHLAIASALAIGTICVGGDGAGFLLRKAGSGTSSLMQVHSESVYRCTAHSR